MAAKDAGVERRTTNDGSTALSHSPSGHEVEGDAARRFPQNATVSYSALEESCKLTGTGSASSYGSINAQADEAGVEKSTEVRK